MSIIIALSLLFCSGCASIINGPDQKVTILSQPEGADILINGQEAGKTPATFMIVRSKNHEISVLKDGYHAETVQLKRSLSPVAIFYLLPGGLVSFGVDATQGSQFSFPDRVDVALKPLFHPQKVISQHLDLLKSLPNG